MRPRSAEERLGDRPLRAGRSRARSSRRAPPRWSRRARGTPLRPVCAAAPLDVGADVGEVGFVEVDDQQQRLRREELEAAKPLQIVAGKLQRAQRRALLRARPCSAGPGRAPSRAPPCAPSSDPFRFARAGARRRRDRRAAARLPSPAHRARDRPSPPDAATASSRNARTTWTSASAFLYPATSTSACAPVRAGAIRSVNSTVAGTRLRGLYIAVSASSRASGTFEMPIADVAFAARRVSGAGHELKEGGLAAGGKTDEGRAKH